MWLCACFCQCMGQLCVVLYFVYICMHVLCKPKGIVHNCVVTYFLCQHSQVCVFVQSLSWNKIIRVEVSKSFSLSLCMWVHVGACGCRDNYTIAVPYTFSVKPKWRTAVFSEFFAARSLAVTYLRTSIH